MLDCKLECMSETVVLVGNFVTNLIYSHVFTATEFYFCSSATVICTTNTLQTDITAVYCILLVFSKIFSVVVK